MTDERTLGQLVADATRDLSDLVHAEIALARAELLADARHAGLAGSMFAAAAYLGLLATLTATITAGYVLVALGLPAWAAFGALTLTLLLVAGLLVAIGRTRVSRVQPPRQALDQARATIALVRPGETDRGAGGAAAR
jgi:hypothetical protein